MAPAPTWLALLLITSPPDSPSAERDQIVAAFKALVIEGVEIDRVRGAYNLVARKALERYPRLHPLLTRLGLPPSFESRDAFADAALRIIDGAPPALFHWLQVEKDDAALSLFATWLDRGRVPPGELMRWFVMSKDAWRTHPGADGTALAKLRRGRKAAPPAHADEPAALVPPEVVLTPAVLTACLAFAEDFLASYEEGDAAPPRASDEEYARLLSTGLLPRGAAAGHRFRDTPADPAVVRGIERLSRDLTREVTGIDPRRTAELVATLPDGAVPENGGWAIVLPGYGVSAGEPLGSGFYHLYLDFLQLRFGARMPVVWQRERGDLERVLLDPSIRRVLLFGHGSMEGYAYEGLTGLPEETMARLIAWARADGPALAQLLQVLLQKGDARPLDAHIEEALEVGWRHWSFEDFEAIASKPGFTPKERLVLCACSVNEIDVKGPRELERALRAVLKARPDASEWLDYAGGGAALAFHPLVPDADRRFREGLPEVLAAAKERIHAPLEVRARRDFTRLLARQTGRFQGNSWITDYVERPEGTTWEPEALAVAIRARLAN